MPAFCHARRVRVNAGVREGIRFFAWVAMASGALVSPSWAQDRDTLRLADAVAVARDVNPMLRAARLRADAARARVPQLGALPDPIVSFGLRNRPLDGFGADERMTMTRSSFSRRFPGRGSSGTRKRAPHTLRMPRNWRCSTPRRPSYSA